MTNLKKDDKILITKNSIFEIMGFKEVTGTVFIVYPDGHGFSFKCDQTKSIETCDFGDGTVQKIP
jgi:hypothetical protein